PSFYVLGRPRAFLHSADSHEQRRQDRATDARHGRDRRDQDRASLRGKPGRVDEAESRTRIAKGGQHERSAGESSGGARYDDAPRPGESSRTSGLADDAVTRPPPPVLGGSRVPGRPPAHAAAIPSLPARQRSGRIRVVGAPDRRGREASPERRLAASAR